MRLEARQTKEEGMGRNSWGCVALVVVGLALCTVGYLKTRPTAMEGFATGIASFAATVDPNARADMEAQMEKLKSERIKRGIPYFLVGALSGAVGIGMLSGRKKA